LLTLEQASKIEALKSASAVFVVMCQLAMRFRGILRSKSADKLDAWLHDAQQSGLYANATLRPNIAAGLSAR
jgi:hypothetical protein